MSEPYRLSLLSDDNGDLDDAESRPRAERLSMTRVLYALAEARRTAEVLTDHMQVWAARRMCAYCTHRQTHSCGKSGR
jgi:hypothetical protein